MGKIKLNLESGAVVEKPLINAFRANNFEYVILDNEMNGSMGLPIILVCKLENGKLIKIEDQNEWQMVKEYLKNIIAGSQVELVKVANVLPANDVYYTQLTLPVPSFDALKKAYTIAGSENENAEVTKTNIPEQTVTETPEVQTENATSQVNITPEHAPEVTSEPTESSNTEVNNISSAPAIDVDIPNAPVTDTPNIPDTTIDLNAPIPVFGDVNETPATNTEDEPIAPSLEMPIDEEDATKEIAPNVEVEPVIEKNNVDENEPVVSIAPETENPFKEQKEAFMQACENMFDALVQKFEKELENNK